MCGRVATMGMKEAGVRAHGRAAAATEEAGVQAW
jgi:hypothetical protein